MLEDGNEDRLKAKKLPKTTQIATNLFFFLRENENLITQRSGMDSIISGFDRVKLSQAGKLYGIDISRYLHQIAEFEQRLLQKQQSQREKDK